MPKVIDETIRSASLVSNDPLLGQVVDSYKIESLLGKGAMGTVYRGVHQLIGKAAAIKVLKADFTDDSAMVQRLIREARTVNAIRHSAIVDIFGFGTLPRTGQPYIVMDLLEGESLDEYIASNAPMKLRQVAPLLDELLSALSAAHAVGVIHRDLKPGNVFVEAKPDGIKSIKVIDFGLAKQADRAGGSVRPTNPGTLLGTPAFMAPEQVLGAKVTPATDLYAVGGIAYQMLTNRLPHEAGTAIEVITQKVSQDPIRPKSLISSIDAELDDWVMKLLARVPESRFQNAEEARKTLRRINEGRTPGPMPSARATEIPKRNWSEAKTVIDEGLSPVLPTPTNTTEPHLAPWRQTHDGDTLPPRNPPSREQVTTLDDRPRALVDTQEIPSEPPSRSSSLGLSIGLLSLIVLVLSILLWTISQP